MIMMIESFGTFGGIYLFPTFNCTGDSAGNLVTVAFEGAFGRRIHVVFACGFTIAQLIFNHVFNNYDFNSGEYLGNLPFLLDIFCYLVFIILVSYLVAQLLGYYSFFIFGNTYKSVEYFDCKFVSFI